MNRFFGTTVALSATGTRGRGYGASSAATGVNGNQNDTSAPNSGAVRNGTTCCLQIQLGTSGLVPVSL